MDDSGVSALPTWAATARSAARRSEAVTHAQAPAHWLRFAVLATPLVGVTFFSKFTIPPLGEQGIDVSLFLVLGAVAAGMVADCIRVDPARLTLYVMLIGILGLIQSLQPETFSIPSLLLLAGLHLPYVFAVPRAGEGDRIVQFFLGVVTLLALLGIAQFALQFVIASRFLFPIENFFPSSFIVQHYNSQAALSYGSEVYRPNGVFMLEPSFFSQLLAVAIVAELCTRARILRLAIFGAALIVSRSGTGVLVLAVCVPLYLAARRRWDLLILGASALILVIALHDVLHLDHVFSRLGEFNSTQSSGFARFVGGFFLFDQYLWTDAWRTLFGYGAGAFSSYAPHARYPVAEMALFKIVFEYGLVGALFYFGFLFGCLSTSRAPLLLILAVAITYLLNGMFASFAHGMALGLLLWCPLERGTPLRALNIRTDAT
jgi:hypothetical protein